MYYQYYLQDCYSSLIINVPAFSLLSRPLLYGILSHFLQGNHSEGGRLRGLREHSLSSQLHSQGDSKIENGLNPVSSDVQMESTQIESFLKEVRQGRCFAVTMVNCLFELFELFLILLIFERKYEILNFVHRNMDEIENFILPFKYPLIFQSCLVLFVRNLTLRHKWHCNLVFRNVFVGL